MILLFVFFFSWCHPLLDPSQQEMIRWNESRKIEFADFKGAVPPGTPWAATTSSMIHFAYETMNGKVSGVSVYASFIPAKSWMKKKIPAVLTHEQLHFDITEVFTRKLYEDVTKDPFASKDKLNTFFKKENSLCDNMQRQYDEETDHGTIENAQKQWGVKVQEMLDAYKPYPDPDGE